VAWFEDPLPPDDLPGYAALRPRVAIPLAGGEALGGLAGYREVLARRLFDIILPETGLAGGLTECKKIVDMAYAFGVECTPHGYASAVGTAAALHLAAALPPQPSPARPALLPFEWAPEPFNRVNELLQTPFEVTAGQIQVPIDRPGLGVEIDRASLARHLIRG
jgi:D-galactarolactone cycloisomerase